MNEPTPRSYGLATALAAIRARAVPILLAGALLACAALAYALGEERTYESEAFVLSRDPGFAEQAFDPTVSVSTAPPLSQAGLAELDGVAEIASESFGGTPSSSEVSDRVSVTESDTGLISIEAEAADAAMAADLANAYAEAVIESRRIAQVDVIRRAQEATEANLEALPPGSAERAPLERKLSDLRDFEAFQTGNLERVQAAVVPGAAVPRPVVSSVIGGGIAGILLGIAGVLLLDRLRPRIMGREGAEEALGSPVIATVDSRGDRVRGGSDSIEAARGRILHRGGLESPRSLLIVPEGAEPATDLAERLADAGAGSGRRTVLIDADLAARRERDRDGAAAGPGLADVLEGAATPAEAIESRPGRADSIRAGDARVDGAGLLEREAMRDVLEELAREYELTVICAPSPLERPDAIPLIGRVDATVAVVAVGASYERCRGLRDEIARLGGTVAGIILLDR